MSFPTVGSRAAQGFLGSTTSHLVDMPASVAARRLLVIVFHSLSATVTTPTGFTAKNPAGGYNNGGAVRTYVFVKRTAGTEGGTQVDCVTGSASLALAITYYFTDDGYSTTACVAASASAATGTSANPNPPSLTTGWGATDFLAIAGMGAGSTVSSVPSGYSNSQTSVGFGAGTAEKQVAAAASEDPGTFTNAGSSAWAAYTIAIRLPLPVTISAINDDTVEDAQTGVILTGTNFEASQGTGNVELGDNLDYSIATKVSQTETAWGNTSITFTVSKGALAYGTIYAFVTNNSGFISAGFPLTILEPEPALLNPSVLAAKMDVVLYDESDNPIGGIVDLIDASIEEAIDSIAVATFKAPLTSQGVSLAIGNTKVQIRRIGEGVLFAGRIIQRSRPVDENGITIVEFTCFDYSVELLRKQVWRSKLQLSLSAQDALDDLLNGTAFTGTVIGSYDTVTKEYINNNLVEAVTELRSVLNAYWRKVPVSREIEIKNYSSPSGIILTNVAQLNQNSQIGAMKAIEDYSEDISAVVNRLGFEIKTDSSRLITLQETTVTVPYVPQSELIRSPRFVSYVAVPVLEDKFTTEFRALGENRYAVAEIPISGLIDGAAASLGGQFMRMLELAPDAGTSGVTTGFWGGIPPKGLPQITFPERAGGAPTAAGAASFENVDQISPYRDTSQAEGNSTSPSGSVTAEVGDLIFAFLVMRTGTAETITPTSSQTKEGELDPLTTGFDPDLVTLWTKAAVAGTNTFNWTLSASAPWIVFMISLKPAKNYYIEDTDSQLLYGVIEDVINFGSFSEVELSNENMANSAFYALVKILQAQKDPPRFLSPDVIYLPGSPLDWNVGDTIRIINQSTTLPISERQIAVKRKHTYDSNGVRTWNLTLSNKPILPLDETALLERALQKISAAQSNQV